MTFPYNSLAKTQAKTPATCMFSPNPAGANRNRYGGADIPDRRVFATRLPRIKVYPDLWFQDNLLHLRQLVSSLLSSFMSVSYQAPLLYGVLPTLPLNFRYSIAFWERYMVPRDGKDDENFATFHRILLEKRSRRGNND